MRLLKRILQASADLFHATFFDRSEQAARENLERALIRLGKGQAG